MRRVLAAGLLSLLLTGCATQQGKIPVGTGPSNLQTSQSQGLPPQGSQPQGSQPQGSQLGAEVPAEPEATPFMVRFAACEAKLPVPPSEQHITILVDGRPELQKGIFLNKSYYREVARCIHGGADAGTPLPIINGRLQLAGPRYSIDIQGSSGQYANDLVVYQPRVELINGRVYLPIDLTVYASSWFDETTQTLILTNRPEQIPSLTNLPQELRNLLGGEGSGLLGGFAHSPRVYAFGKPDSGFRFRELPIHDFQPHVQAVTEGGAEILVAPLRSYELGTGVWLHLPSSRPVLIGYGGDDFALGFPTPAEALDHYRDTIGVPSKAVVPIKVDGERAEGAFDVAGQRFHIYFHYRAETAHPPFAGWSIEGITWGQNCAQFQYCPPVRQ